MTFLNKILTKSTGSQHTNSPFHKRSIFWILLLVFLLVIQFILPTSAWERLYYQGLCPLIRVSYDFMLGWSPLPMIYVIAVFLLFRTILWLLRWKRGFINQALRALGGIAAMIVAFYVLWGFNYNQIALPKRLNFQFENVTTADIRNEFIRASKTLQQEAASLPQALQLDQQIQAGKISEKLIRENVESSLRQLGLPNNGRVRIRQLWPPGTLLRWGTAGIYLPHTFEGHIDQGMLSVQKPFSMAHEMAHGYGVTDEGACNFIAWLACQNAEDPWLRYGGALSYWRYTAAEMPYDTVENMLMTFPPVIRRSIALIRENNKKYPDLVPKTRDKIYSAYLKQHGVQKGLQSYNEVVMMVQQYLLMRPDLNRKK